MNHPLLQRVHNVYTTYPKVLTAIPISRLAANSCPHRVPAAVAIPTVVNSHPKLRSEAIVEMPGGPTVSEHLREKGTQVQGGRPLDKGLYAQERISTDLLGKLQSNSHLTAKLRRGIHKERRHACYDSLYHLHFSKKDTTDLNRKTLCCLPEKMDRSWK